MGMEGVVDEATQGEAFPSGDADVLSMVTLNVDGLGEYTEAPATRMDKILDTAGQKGTGIWTGVSSLDLGIPVTLIGEAVFARCLSALKSQRELAATLLGNGGVKPLKVNAEEKAAFVDAIRQALLASKIVSYAQGFMLLAEAAKVNSWKLNFGEI